MNYNFKSFWRCFWLIVFVIIPQCLSAAALTTDQILDNVDKNLTSQTAKMSARMLIHVGDEVRTKEFTSFSRGRDQGFTQFTYPNRDKGITYLKIQDNLWMYLPSVEKVIKIEGQMLRQSMMGSDFSYEDVLERSALREKYFAEVLKEELVDIKTENNETAPRLCLVLELTAKVKNVTYFQRKIWIDKEYFIPLREELFAVSGKKLKIIAMGNIKKFKDRYYPLRTTMKNLLRQDSWTELIVTDIKFDLKITPDIFTERNLRK